MALQNPYTVDFMISDILSLVHKYSKIFHFKWIRGHSGVTENELADSMAKEAIQSTEVPSFSLLCWILIQNIN